MRMAARGALAGCVAMAALAGGAHAQRLSKVNGAELARLCTGKALGGCDAYIAGVADTVEAFQRSAAQSKGEVKIPATVCIPADVTGTALRQTVTAWVAGHAESGKEQASFVVVRALRAGYPCKAGTPP